MLVGILCTACDFIVTGKQYIALDWHPRAKAQFFNDKSAEDFRQDDSYHGKVVPKKQVLFMNGLFAKYLLLKVLYV